MVYFIFVILNFFRYLLPLRRYNRKSVEVGVFRRGVNLSADFRGKGAYPTNYCWYQSSRVIVLSCGIKISAVHHLVLSPSTRLTDRQTDRQMDRRTDRITTPSSALAYARAVKNLMACSHRRRGRDKTVLSCRVGGVNTIGDQTKLSCLVCSCVHTANSTRQDSFVASLIMFTPPTRTRQNSSKLDRDSSKLGQDETKLSCLVALAV